MHALDITEYKRIEVQSSLDATKTQLERNKLGQFATPTALATDMLSYAQSLVARQVPLRFLDPAIGTGSFLSALLRTFPHSKIAEIVGYEIDPHYAYKAIELWDQNRLKLHIADFTRSSPPTTDDQKANLLICNPPYVRHHYLATYEKQRLQKITEQITGIKLSELCGLYCHFLCIAHAWMAEDAIAGWLIPAEFMDVNYGQQVKKYLLQHVTLLRVHRFDPKNAQFDDAIVSSAVIWFRKTAPQANHSVEFTYGGSLLQPKISRIIPLCELSYTAKWTQFNLIHSASKTNLKQLKLADLFEIKRGLATGANKFFILPKKQVVELNIPAAFFVPILPGPRYLQVNEVEADIDGNPMLENSCSLLNCNLSENVLKAYYPSLWRYLQTGIELGISQRYLCRHRSPWYLQENRPAALFLCTYMGRQSNKSDKPFRFILNHSRATAPNVYLMMYPKPLLKQAFVDDPLLIKALWQALNTIPSEQLMGEGRVYGDGLYKLEPRELANVSADKLLSELPALLPMRLCND
jgi:adenine-specific DNA-methyltransferase